MKRIDYYVTAAIFVAFLFQYSPIVAGGQFVEIDWQVTGSGSQSGTIITDLDWDLINNNPQTLYSWTMIEDIEIDLGPEVGTAWIDGLSIGVKGDPFIDFGFSARSANGPTHFAFSSEILLVNPNLASGADAAAEASVIGSIDSGDFNGNLYQAVYNDTEVFAELINAPVTVFGMDAEPSTTLTETITSMQVHWGMVVASGGQAAGNSHFEIEGAAVPEPATIALLGLGFLALRRKR